MKIKKDKKIIGWREWVSLPDLGIHRIKAKVDTGARTSSLYAVDLKYFSRRGEDFVKFTIHPMQRNTEKTVRVTAKVLEYRRIRSSNGHVTKRPVILTTLELFGDRVPIELTLANRDDMGFRMLLGRECLRSRWIVDVGRSYLGEKNNLKQERISNKRKVNK